MKKLFIIFLTVWAMGFGSSFPALADDDAAAKIFSTDPDQSNIYIYRKGNIFGMAIPFQVYVDGKPIGAIANKKYRLIKVPPGEHVIYALANENQKSLALKTKPGENYYIRIGVKVGFVSPRVKIKLESEKKAQKEILKLNPSPPFFVEE